MNTTMPILGYLEAYGLTSYGVLGGILLLFGIWKLAHRKDWRQIGVFLILPVFVILFLSKYQIVLGRNLSLILPFAYLFMVYGLMETEAVLEKRRFYRKGMITAVLALMVAGNVETAF